jgi:hypothetical protein
MTSKLKTDVLETVSGSGTIALTNQLSGMTYESMAAGSVVQVVTVRSDDLVTYSGANSYHLTPLNITIVPKYANSKLIIQFNFSGEGAHNQTLKVTKDGNTVITTSGEESYNANSGNQRWSGARAIAYDNDTSSTPTDMSFMYQCISGSTASRVYSVQVRTSSSSNETFSLNRTGNGTMGDGNETSMAFVTATEIKQ